MAIKLSGSISRKIPIESVPYSSQSFSAGMEVEINSADAATIQAQLTQLYASLSEGIDAQIATATQHVAPVAVNQQAAPAAASCRNGNAPVVQPPAPQAQNGYTNGRSRVAAQTNGNGRRITCTEAQAKCIYAICKAQGLDMISVLADFNVADPRDLHVKDASRVIDLLKAQQNDAAH